MIDASVQICTAGWQCTQAVPVDLDFPELLIWGASFLHR